MCVCFPKFLGRVLLQHTVIVYVVFLWFSIVPIQTIHPEKVCLRAIPCVLIDSMIQTLLSR
jgi:hypothetical protein